LFVFITQSSQEIEPPTNPGRFNVEESWYEVGSDKEEGQIEFLVQDPDGYLLRFIEPLGERIKEA